MKRKVRKTIEVAKVLETANKLFANTEISQEEKSGVSALLEEILHATNQYKGFNDIYWRKTGYRLWVEAGKPDFPEKKKFMGPEWDRFYY